LENNPANNASSSPSKAKPNSRKNCSKRYQDVHFRINFGSYHFDNQKVKVARETSPLETKLPHLGVIVDFYYILYSELAIMQLF